MDIIIKSVNFEPDFKLKEFIREKIGKLFNHTNDIIMANVILRQSGYNDHGNKLCEIRLMVPGYDHFVKRSTEVYEKPLC